MPRLHCKAILFDLDGTLVDSAAVVERYWSRWATQYGFEPADLLRIAHGRRPIDTVRTLLPDAEDPERLAAEIVAGEATDAEGLIVIEGAPELIGTIPGGRWTVATSGPIEIASFRLRFAGIPVPPSMVTAEDVRSGKPEPEPYLLAARRLGFRPEECIVIEDAAAGVRSGFAAGATVIGITTNNPAELLKSAGAHHTVADYQAMSVNVESDGLSVSL